jgi:hypothetical protein
MHFSSELERKEIMACQDRERSAIPNKSIRKKDEMAPFFGNELLTRGACLQGELSDIQLKWIGIGVNMMK